MKLSQQEVEHVAKLARLDLTDQEKKTYAEQLSAVLDYISELDKVDTDDVEPTSQVTGLLNVMRDDEATAVDEPTRQQILKDVPDKDGDYIKVKGVFE